MADLTGTTPADTYKSLLQIGDATNGVDATAKYIEDGEGTDSALAISTGNIGIGTDNPGVRLHLENTEERGDYASTYARTETPDFFVRNTQTTSSIGSTKILIQNIGTSGTAEAVVSVVNQLNAAGALAFSLRNPDDNTNIVERMRIDSSGNVGIGTDSFGTDAAGGVIGIGNATAPTSSPADMVQLYAEDVTASSELRVRDEAGNVTTLSPHAKDAPDSLYDQGKGIDEMHRVANHYLGTIVFTNVDRRNDLLQKQLNGEDLPVDRTFKVTETFTEYNARTGADLQVEDWDANQQAMFDAQEEKVAARQAEIDAWDNEEKEAPEPLQSYVKKPKPDWLS
jgi:hypothetical protein